MQNTLITETFGHFRHLNFGQQQFNAISRNILMRTSHLVKNIWIYNKLIHGTHFLEGQDSSYKLNDEIEIVRNFW